LKPKFSFRRPLSPSFIRVVEPMRIGEPLGLLQCVPVSTLPRQVPVTAVTGAHRGQARTKLSLVLSS